ncbi:CbiQ family ECF transporter T component [Salidesulfovibrio onnuriiensis]|uniref:CbiQ family ECF transporter T component n=1 Tax=Salidesulfovibrio onnuriiensis TaxID=2583823 RepID=UPI0016500E9A|nr:CbiQ family ECF transporter T component [Salidesulfovibrio onnuriiensis]
MIDFKAVQSLDPRLKIGAVLLLGAALWNTGWWGLCLCAVLLFFLFALAGRFRAETGDLVRRFLLFVLFWMGLKIVLGVVRGEPLGGVLSGSLFFGFRLFLLLLTGLALAVTTSARQLGQSLSWVLRPFLGRDRAWKPALALALMTHFLPQCAEAFGTARTCLSMRFPHAPAYRKALLYPQMVLRFMGQKTWDRTLAVTVRGLDEASAWVPGFCWKERDTVAAGLVALAGAAVFML